MSYLKKLKELIGEEAYKKVVADLGDKELIINDGSYIPKDKFNEKLDEIKELNKEKSKLSGDLKTAQDSLKKLQDENESGSKTVEQKIAALEKKLADQDTKLSDQDTKLADKDKQLQIRDNEALLKEALTNAGVKKPQNLKLLLREFELDKIEVGEDGKIKGFDDKVKKLQEDYKPLFGEDKFGGTPPGGGGDQSGGDDMKEMSTEDFYSSEVFGSGK